MPWLACLLLVVVASTAAAQAEPYQDVVREGIHEFTAGNFVEARTLFERAHALKPSARTFRGLGLISYELKHYVQALRELEAALADARNPLTDEQRAEVKAAVAKTRRYVGTLVLEVRPAGANVAVDGQPLRERELLLDAGDHTIEAQLSGHRDIARTLTVLGGQRISLELSLKPLELSPEHAARGASSEPTQAGDHGSRAPGVDDAEGDGLLSQWWFWTLAGVVVAGAAVTTAVVVGDHDQQATYKGTTGVALRPP